MTEARKRPARTSTSGAKARGQNLLDGLVVRATRGDELAVRQTPEGVELCFGRRAVVVLQLDGADVVVDLDPRAGVGDPAAMRRFGDPHPDRTLSARGWRQAVVRNQADGARVVDVLRPQAGPSLLRPRAHGGLTVGTVRVRYLLDAGGPEDGTRVFVDVAWPKDIAKGKVRLDQWMPQVAPSTTLRAAYGMVSGIHRGFRRHYLAELRGGAAASLVSRLRALNRQGGVTLLTGVRDLPHCAAIVLAHAVTHGRTPKV